MSGPIRGMRNVEGKLLVVSGNTLYQISNAGVAIPRGTVPGTGLVQMSHNQVTGGNQLIIVNGSAGYIFNTSTLVFERITDPGYPGAKAVDYIDSYFVQVEPAGRFWFHSNLADGLDYNTLDRYEAEGQPDRIVTLAVSAGEVVVFGQRTAEFFVNTGAATGTFQSKGIVLDTGCAGTNSVVLMDNSLMWLDDLGVFQRMNGYQAVPISNRVIESAIAGYDWANVVAYTYEDRGRKIAYWTFRDGITLGYDVTTGKWHRRASYGLDRWRLTSIVNVNRKWYGGDFQAGKLYELDWDYKLDGTQPLVRRYVSGPISNEQRRFSVPSAELVFDTGGPVSVVGTFPEQPLPPTISGAAPDGTLGIDYPAFDYNAIEGDNPLSGFSLATGPLPPGLGPVATPARLNGGVPTAIGTYQFTVRVTDTAGLSALHTDTIVIGVPWFAGRLDGPSGGEGIRSATGLDWTGTPDLLLGSAGMFSGEGRLYLTSGSGARYSTDYGVTFTDATGFDAGISVLVGGDYTGGTYFIRSTGGAGPSPAFDDQQTYRSDAGLTFTKMTLPSNLRDIRRFIVFNSVLYGFGVGSDGGNYCTSANLGVSFNTSLAICFDTNVNANDADSDGSAMIVVGASNKIARTTNGTTFTLMVSPFAGSGEILHIKWHAGRWVMINDTGVIATSATGLDNSWTIAAFTIPTLANDMDAADGKFVIACQSGNMVVSSDGTTFSLAPSSFPGTANILGVAALRTD